MAHLKLSKQGLGYLSLVMAELGMERIEGKNDRPEALRIAFAKGIAAQSPLSTEKIKDLSDFEFPTTVIAKDDEIILVKHLIIEKLQRKIEDNELDKYIHLFIEHGLKTMYEEIQGLSSAEDYLFYLLDKHSIS